MQDRYKIKEFQDGLISIWTARPHRVSSIPIPATVPFKQCNQFHDSQVFILLNTSKSKKLYF
jgi:hypothetical protein